MSFNKLTGAVGEDMACSYLLGLGYRILARNFTVAQGEIDIIAADRDCIVFVEVKRRMTTRYGLPQDAVTPQKQFKISQVAAIYLKKYFRENPFFRFDVVSIFDKEITHIRYAFDSKIRM